MKTAISNIDLLKIIDKKTQRTVYGSDQEWYRSVWQRRSGCGPSTVSNIIYYLARTREGAGTFSHSEFLKLMEDVWEHVTPTMRGINSTGLLCKGVLSYARANGAKILTETMDIPRCRSERPAIWDVATFIAQALADDIPVAFLNLHNGGQPLLDSWHWVTVVGLEYDPSDEKNTFIDFVDAGTLRRINLAQWLDLTTQGGGFVRFKQE